VKAVLVLLVLALAPFHVSLGPVSLPVSWLLAVLEVVLTAGGTWLAVRIIRRSRPLWCPALISGGAW